MAETGTVTVAATSVNRDGMTPVRLITAMISAPTDVQTVQSAGGVDDCPIPGDVILILEAAGAAWKVSIPLDDLIPPTALPGEKILYSRSAPGVAAAKIALRNTGIMELNGAADWVVAYTDLKIAFDQLKSDFNTFVTVKYNLHNHPTAPTGIVSVPSVIGTATTADMTAAKVATVMCP
jgi:hypothetical protein